MVKRAGFDLGAATVNKNSGNKVQQVQQVQQEGAKRKTMWFTKADRELLAKLKKVRILERGEAVSDIQVIREALKALK